MCKQNLLLYIRFFYRGKISTLEDLSNEIFFKIFDYMDGCDILYAFSNLNHRFEQLFKSLLIMLNIDPNNQSSKTYLFDMWKQILHCNKGQIIRIYLTMSSLPIKEFFSSFSFDSSFNRLDTLYLDNFQSDLLIRFLKNLYHLPGLT